MGNNLSKPELIDIYRQIYTIRKVEERIADIYPSDKIKSPIHLSIGQEAASVGVCKALTTDDVVFGTYRGHALYLAKGGNLKSMIAELFGKYTGCGKGKAGSMHLADKAVGMMGTSAIVASTIPQAVGYSLAQKMLGSDTAVCVFFGDGATEEGVFWESLNFSSLKSLPILFVCENNHYAINTPIQKRMAVPNYCERVSAFGVPAVNIKENDVFKIISESKRLVSEVRAKGPQFLEIETYRWREHVGPGTDWHLGYRSAEEVQFWVENDQLSRVASLLTKQELENIQSDCELEICEAFEFAEVSPFPRDEELYTDVFQ